jgi:cytochrome c biogenesis protein CcdA
LKEKAFFEDLAKQRDDFNLVYLDITKGEIKPLFLKLAEKYQLPKVTPITLIGNSIIQGFDSAETTGARMIKAIDSEKDKKVINFDDYLAGAGNVYEEEGATCGDDGVEVCLVDIEPEQNFEFTIPFFGRVDFKDFSLFSLAAVLGFVDGFNPCAMWVLITFLLILWQVGDRKRMFQVAGLFIVAEAVMYWLILNFWYKTFDFVGLDHIVTPAIGLLAIVGGVFFLRRYFKKRKELTCDVTNIEYQNKTIKKMEDLVKSPLTILTALGIIGIAFSVNIIEFACSVGIPQAFTKILEINNLNLFKEQFYILIYTIFYMVDDLVVFGLALYGFKKFQATGLKYANLSALIGGVLMIILGILMLFMPNLLVF